MDWWIEKLDKVLMVWFWCAVHFFINKCFFNQMMPWCSLWFQMLFDANYRSALFMFILLFLLFEYYLTLSYFTGCCCHFCCSLNTRKTCWTFISCSLRFKFTTSWILIYINKILPSDSHQIQFDIITFINAIQLNNRFKSTLTVASRFRTNSPRTQRQRRRMRNDVRSVARLFCYCATVSPMYQVDTWKFAYIMTV